ncbi:MAG TPA: hypothetical protein P5548_03435 [Candidatus Moranbacteria bacterium]|nr:hypothetical protein [Candidatus Moranbacteria bacterium]HRZ33923.1 hypothetical protein [Candidatus Moranbacteria bacterium]
MLNGKSIFENPAKGNGIETGDDFRESVLEGSPLERVIAKVRSKLKMTDLNDKQIQKALLANDIEGFVETEVSSKLPLSPKEIEILEENAAEKFASGVAYMTKSFEEGILEDEVNSKD